ncbi:MAG: hypothetical protein AAF840_12825, partial [Bacteroidota bacterium]
ASTSGTNPTFEWKRPMGIRDTTRNDEQTFENAMAGTYCVIVTDINGCTNTDTIAIEYNDPPLPPAIAGLETVCLGQNNVRFEAIPGTNATAQDIYQWDIINVGAALLPNYFSGPVTYANVTASGSGTFDLTLTADRTGGSNNGCASADTITINISGQAAPNPTEVYLFTEGNNSFLIGADPPTVGTNMEVCYEWGRDDGTPLTDNRARIYYPAGRTADQILDDDYYLETWVAVAGDCMNTTDRCRNRNYYTGRSAPSWGVTLPEQLAVTVFPNPARGTFTTLDIRNPTPHGSLDIAVFDLLGRRVHHQLIQTGSRGYCRYRLPLQNLATGHHRVVLTDPENGAQRSLPLIINR